MKPFVPILVLSLLVTGAACAKKTPANTNQGGMSNATIDDQIGKFPSGIYYRLPNRNDPSAILSRIGTPLTPQTVMSPVDFSIRTTRAVYANNNEIFYVTPTGINQNVAFPGIYQMARPSLSPTGLRVAVQATRTPHGPEEAADPTELQIFVVDVAPDIVTQISPDEAVPHESPVWFNQSNKIAYSSFSERDGVDIHIYDLDQNKEVLTIQNAGWHGIAVSKDDTKIFVPNSMRIYSAVTGELLVDLKATVTAGLAAAEFPLASNIGDSGSPFLDGDWSPDGTQLVFDAIIVDHSEPHSVLFTMQADGTGITAITDRLEVNPDFSNNFNFSQVNPIWL
jgi:hypothetical protein